MDQLPVFQLLQRGKWTFSLRRAGGFSGIQPLKASAFASGIRIERRRKGRQCLGSGSAADVIEASRR